MTNNKFKPPVYQSDTHDLKLSLGWVRRDKMERFISCPSCHGTGECQGGFGSLSMPGDDCNRCQGSKTVSNPEWVEHKAPPFPDDLFEHLVAERDKFIKERVDNPRRYLTVKDDSDE